MTQRYFDAARTLLFLVLITLTLTTALEKLIELPPVSIAEFNGMDLKHQHILVQLLTPDERTALMQAQLNINNEGFRGQLNDEYDVYLPREAAEEMNEEINKWKATIAEAQGKPAPEKMDFKAALMGTQASGSTSSREPPAEKSYKTVLMGSKQRRN